VGDAGHAGVSTGLGAQLPPSADLVRGELERVLASPDFVASDRLKKFLRFVVEEAVAGRGDRLHAYPIALEALGRDASFDPQTDPVVRMEAGRLRRRLERYYLEAGQSDPVRIDIPKGGYVPTFTRQADERPTRETPASAAPWHRLQRGWPGRRWLALGAFALAGVVLLATVALRLEHPTVEVEGGLSAPQEHGPAIIVLPLEDLSGAHADDVFAAGLTEELISNLMRFGELRLYSSYGSFLEQPSADPVELSERLGVGYVVKGSVRLASDRIRLIVHLVEAQTGRHVWSQTYDRALTPENVFAVQEQLAADLAGELAQPYGLIHEVTADSFRRGRPETLFAYECVLRAFAYRRTEDLELYGPARACLEDAVRRDPGYANAWALLAFLYLDEYRYGYGPRAGDASMLDLALDTARHAVELDGSGVYGMLALSALHFYQREFNKADKIHRRLLLLSPANPEVLAQVGWRTAFLGRWDEGVALLEQAIARSIRAPNWYHLHVALHHYHRGDYRAALVQTERLTNADGFWTLVLLAAIRGKRGNQDEARIALERAKALNPDFLRDPWDGMRIHHFPEDLIDQLIDGLRKAGLDASASIN
jgi:TolB-like protein